MSRGGVEIGCHLLALLINRSTVRADPALIDRPSHPREKRRLLVILHGSGPSCLRGTSNAPSSTFGYAWRRKRDDSDCACRKTTKRRVLRLTRLSFLQSGPREVPLSPRRLRPSEFACSASTLHEPTASQLSDQDPRKEARSRSQTRTINRCRLPTASGTEETPQLASPSGDRVHEYRASRSCLTFNRNSAKPCVQLAAILDLLCVRLSTAFLAEGGVRPREGRCAESIKSC
jgi:hypothetical protein